MKWFKHMSSAHTGDTLSQIFDEFGFAGIGMYWTLVEVVAFHWKEGEPKLKRSPKAWRKLTGIYPQTFVELLRFLGGISEVSSTFDEKAIEVCIPKLLKIKDEYARKSGQAPDKVAPEGEGEEEKKKKEADKPRPNVGKDGSTIELHMPLKDSSPANITTKTINEWEQAHRFIDVRSQLVGLISWFEGDGADKRWTKKQWFCACGSWLGKRSNEAKQRMAQKDPTFNPVDPRGEIAAQWMAEETKKRTSLVRDIVAKQKTNG